MSETLELARREAAKYGVEAEFIHDATLPSFEIRRHSGHTVIAAPTDVEALYGVYDAAERFGGYCFFEPGRERHDAAAGLPLPEDGIAVPAVKPLLKRRGFIQEFPFNSETGELFDWMAKNKLNYLLVWMKYYDELSEDLKNAAHIRGIEIESGHHNFDYWIPGKVYGKDHPEFFAEIGGHRISPSGNSELLLSEQLCTTNPELRKELVRRIVEYAGQHPEVKTISLVPNDGFGWCECPECSKYYDKNEKGDLYSLSTHVYKADRIYHAFVQDVAAQLHEIRPDLNITMVAYINYCAPSKGFTLEKGMAVHFADYWRCINHTIDSADCPINSHYADDIRKWCSVKHGGEVNIYEYFMGVNFYLSLPMVHFEDMFHEMRWYSRTGVDGILTQFHIPHWSVYGINYCMMARAARGEDEQQAIAWIFHRLFGADAEQARAFYAFLKNMMLSMGNCHVPYPYSLFRRTKAEQYAQADAMSRKLAERQPENRLAQELTVWTEYMLRFKGFFDDYNAGKAGLEDAEALLAWIHSHRDTRVFVHDRFDMYFQAIFDAIKGGTRWIHFNIDWEDAYIIKHEELLK